MGIKEILTQIDEEIAQLVRARALLAGKAEPTEKKAGSKRRRKKRTLSPEGRQRIADAVKKRWAAQRKAASQG